MGQRCQPNPEDLDPNGGRAYLAPDQIEQQIRMLESGRYRLSAVSAYFGQTRQALNNRMTRDDELGRRYRQAKAKGEMKLSDALFDDDPEYRDSAKWVLERIHGVQKPLDQAKTLEARRVAKAAQMVAGADLETRRKLREFLTQASATAEGDEGANAENASEAP